MKYKNSIIASSLTAAAIPMMSMCSSKTIFASQIVNIGVQLGTQTWVAAIGGPSMFANLDAETFAHIQAVLFPR